MGGPTRSDPPERDEPSMLIEVIPDRSPQPTMELETADLKELAMHGTLVAPRQHISRNRAAEPKVVVKQPTVAVEKVLVDFGDLGDDIPVPVTTRESSEATATPGTPIHVRRVTPARPRVHMDKATKKSARGGMWFVVLIYIVSSSALGLSIYFRFIA